MTVIILWEIAKKIISSKYHPLNKPYYIHVGTFLSKSYHKLSQSYVKDSDMNEWKSSYTIFSFLRSSSTLDSCCPLSRAGEEKKDNIYFYFYHIFSLRHFSLSLFIAAPHIFVGEWKRKAHFFIFPKPPREERKENIRSEKEKLTLSSSSPIECEVKKREKVIFDYFPHFHICEEKKKLIEKVNKEENVRKFKDNLKRTLPYQKKRIFSEERR